MKAEPGALLGKYQLTSLLGSGGMAEVWKAKILGAAGFERSVVVKRILPHLAQDEDFVRLFIAEAQTSALLHHPNIVQVFELGECDGEFFMALELVDGYDLGRAVREVVRQGRAIPQALAAAIVRDVCRALAHAHDLRDSGGTPLRIVHRDVSPSNVLLGKEGTVKLLDFGVAKALGSSFDVRSRSGTLTGKASYMSPEQADGRRVDPRSDLFAAGIILYELLTRQRLFKAESELETLAMVRRAEVKPPSSINPEIPAALDDICMRALARELPDRYATGQAFAEDLEPFAHGVAAEGLRRFVAELFEEDVRAQATAPRTMTRAPMTSSSAAELDEASRSERRTSEQRGRPSIARPAVWMLVAGLVVALIVAMTFLPRRHASAPAITTIAPGPSVAERAHAAGPPPAPPLDSPQANPGPELTTPAAHPRPAMASQGAAKRPSKTAVRTRPTRERRGTSFNPDTAFP